MANAYRLLGATEAGRRFLRVLSKNSAMKFIFTEMVRGLQGPTYPGVKIQASSANRLDFIEASHSSYPRPLPSDFGVLAKKRVAIVSPLPPTKSGVSTYAFDLGKKLAEKYEVFYVLPRTRTPKRKIPNGCVWISEQQFLDPSINFNLILYQIGNSPHHNQAIELSMKRPGVVELHDVNLSHLNLANSMERGHLLRDYYDAVHYSHGYKSLVEIGKKENLNKFESSLLIAQAATRLVLHSESAIQLLERKYGANVADKCVRINLAKPPVLSNSFVPREEANSFAIKVSSFGFISDDKFPLDIVTACKKLAKVTGKQVQITFVGEASSEDISKLLDQEAQQTRGEVKVVRTGWVSDVDLAKHYANSDVILQLRKTDKGETSAAVIDALSTGIPLIVSDIGSMSDLPGEYVYKVDNQRLIEELVESLLAAIKFDNNQRREAVIRYYEEQHSMQYLERKISELIENQDYCLDSNFRYLDIPSKPKLFLNVSSVRQHDLGTGIQRTTKELLKQFIEHQTESHRVVPVYFDVSNMNFVEASNYTANLLGLHLGSFTEQVIRPLPGDWFLSLDLTFDSHETEALDILRDKGVYVAHILYDLLPLKMPEYFPTSAVSRFKNWLEMAQKFDAIICISKTVMEELARHLDSLEFADKPRVGWFHLGAEFLQNSKSPADPESRSFPSREPNFLLVGTVEPRKNYELVLGAFRLLWASGRKYKLTLVGRRGHSRHYLREELRALEDEPRFSWLDDANDDVLLEEYEAADALIFASHGEGFGLPIVEAHQNGLRLIIRDISIFREVAGDDAYYFNDATATALAESIDSWTVLWRDGAEPKGETVAGLTWTDSYHLLIAELKKLGWKPGEF